MAIGTIPDHLIKEFAQSIGGIPFIGSAFLPIFSQVSIKKHNLKRWMTKSNYHNRIQKKWDKKHGLVDQRSFFFMNGQVVAHPENIKFITNLL